MSETITKFATFIPLTCFLETPYAVIEVRIKDPTDVMLVFKKEIRSEFVKRLPRIIAAKYSKVMCSGRNKMSDCLRLISTGVMEPIRTNHNG
jgi:hypothetical protein